MKSRALLVPLFIAVTLALSACSPRSLLSSTSVFKSPTPTPRPTPLPTVEAVYASNSNGFDNHAGNCVDAATQAITLIDEAQSARFGASSFTMDMQLNISPTSYPNGPGCADAPAHIGRYRALVGKATLLVWPLDQTWSASAPAIRQQWLADVLNAVYALYPHADVGVSVQYNGSPCGSATLNAGAGGGRQIDPSCG